MSSCAYSKHKDFGVYDVTDCFRAERAQLFALAVYDQCVFLDVYDQWFFWLEGEQTIFNQFFT